jgi:hypothetical protein
MDRERTELVQHSSYRENAHRRNVASSHIINVVWLDYIARLSQWGGRRSFACPWWLLPVFAVATGGGEGGDHAPSGDGKIGI